jgi:hypothetical protein
MSSNRYERTTGLTTFVCPVCGRASVLDIPDQLWLFARCSMCQPDLPLVDGAYVDGDYVIEPKA